MLFRDRLDAADRLAAALAPYRGCNPLVLAIPRGAVPIGAALAQALDGELDVVLVHKLSSRWNPEYAIGAIDEGGRVFVSDPEADDAAWLAAEKARRLDELRRRRTLYSGGAAGADPQGRITIVVDDGLATGATMLAALHAVRARRPQKLVCAVPVAAPSSLERVRPYADELVCLHAPADFQAVGQFFARFGQVEDDEVVDCLRRHRGRDGDDGACGRKPVPG